VSSAFVLEGSVRKAGNRVHGQHDNAMRRFLRAIELDPNSAFARGYLGTAYGFSGECDPAIQNLNEAMHLSPRDFLMVVWFIGSAWAYLSAEKYEQAADCANRAIDPWRVCCGLCAPWTNG
jgi:tetratricopeptide (TPR) repeat protein